MTDDGKKHCLKYEIAKKVSIVENCQGKNPFPWGNKRNHREKCLRKYFNKNSSFHILTTRTS